MTNPGYSLTKNVCPILAPRSSLGHGSVWHGGKSWLRLGEAEYHLCALWTPWVTGSRSLQPNVGFPFVCDEVVVYGCTVNLVLIFSLQLLLKQKPRFSHYRKIKQPPNPVRATDWWMYELLQRRYGLFLLPRNPHCHQYIVSVFKGMSTALALLLN